MKHLSVRWGGFTLIEILIVVTIIGMLGIIVLASVSSARAKARDASTIATTVQYRTALSMIDSGKLPDPGSGSTYYCLDRSAGQTCQFWGTTYSATSTVASAVQEVISTRSATLPVSIDGTTFDAIVYKCMSSYTNGTCNAAIYWVQSNNTACTGGIVVYQGSGGSVCASNASDSGTNNVEAPPASFSQGGGQGSSCGTAGHPPCVSPSL